MPLIGWQSLVEWKIKERREERTRVLTGRAVAMLTQIPPGPGGSYAEDASRWLIKSVAKGASGVRYNVESDELLVVADKTIADARGRARRCRVSGPEGLKECR